MLTILDKVRKYKQVDNRFHTPSHSTVLLDELYSNAKYDITELSFSDNLLYANGVLLELEKELQKVYNTKRTLVITAGATTGNFIGLNTIKSLGKVLITSGCHKSIVSAIRLFDVDAVFMDDVFYSNGLPRPITKQDIEKYLVDDIKSVVITSPTYFGDVVDEELIEWLQSKGIVVMVDEAHGGHFAFSNLLPKSLSSVADIVIDSVHKTLPVYTGGALIHINNNSLIAQSELYHSLLHTSSPNYVTMCSIDYMQDLFSREGEKLYSNLYKVVKNIKLDNFKVVKTDDFTRLVIDTSPYSADYIASVLEEKQVFVEMSYKHYLVLILSPLNTKIINDSVKIINSLNNLDSSKIYAKQDIPTKSKNIKAQGEAQLVELASAVGKVSFSEVGIYPPGIPILKYGDIITTEQVNYLLKNKESLFGLTDGKIFVIKPNKAKDF